MLTIKAFHQPEALQTRFVSALLKLILGPMLLKYLGDRSQCYLSVEASRIKTNTTTIAQYSRYTGCVLMQLARHCRCPGSHEMRLQL